MIKSKKSVLFIIILCLLLISCKKVERYYDKYGRLSSEYTMKKGVPHGTATFYFNDQVTVLQTSEYRNGILEGKSVRWHYTGYKEYEEYYHNGKLEGIKRMWDKNGNLIVEEEYSEGELNGYSKKWYENGQIQIDAFYLNGLPHGKWHYYNSNGIEVGYANFDKGTGQQVSLNLDGSIRSIEKYYDGIKYEDIHEDTYMED